MSDKTGIEWTDATWNPVRGCTRVSQGCVNCYAETVAARFSDKGQAYEGLATRSPARWTGEVKLIESALDQPLRWTRSRRIFVNSMSDLFHEKLEFAEIDRIFAVMALSMHTFQVLTKRPERMKRYFERPGLYQAILRIADNDLRRKRPKLGSIGIGNPATSPLRNVWLGVSVENQETADERIPLLLQTPAAKRFLSCEPLLGPVDLTEIKCHDDPSWVFNCLSPGDTYLQKDDLGRWNSGDGPYRDNAIDWVITGGESGREARPMNVQWARDIRDACRDCGTAFFHKQNGEYQHTGEHPERVGKKAAGRLLDGVEYSEFPVDQLAKKEAA